MNGLWVILPDGESFVVQEGPFVAFLDGSMTAEADPQVGKTHSNALSPSLSSGSASVERYSLRSLFVVEECPQLQLSSLTANLTGARVSRTTCCSRRASR